MISFPENVYIFINTFKLFPLALFNGRNDFAIFLFYEVDVNWLNYITSPFLGEKFIPLMPLQTKPL